MPLTCTGVLAQIIQYVKENNMNERTVDPIEARQIRDFLQYNQPCRYTRFKYTNMYVGEPRETAYGYISPIKSYATIVGYIDVAKRLIVECGKYSHTTSTEFTQLCNSKADRYDRCVAYSTKEEWA